MTGRPARRAATKKAASGGGSDDDFEGLNYAEYSSAEEEEEEEEDSNCSESDFSLAEEDDELEEEEDEPEEEDDEDEIEPSPSKKKKTGKETTGKSKKSPKPTPSTKKGAAKADKSKKNADNSTKGKKGRKSKGDSKDSKKLDGDPEDVVLKYLLDTNRPYSVINIYDNLHKSFTKTVIQNVLDILSSGDSPQIICKTYGKSKIYYANQDLLPALSNEGLSKLLEDVEEEKATIQELQGQYKLLHEENQKLGAQPTDEELTEHIKTLGNEIKALEARIAAASAKSIVVDPVEKEKRRKKFLLYRSTWIKRKRTVTDIVDNFSERMDKKPKEVYAMCDIETDEDVGVKIPSKT